MICSLWLHWLYPAHSQMHHSFSPAAVDSEAVRETESPDWHISCDRWRCVLSGVSAAGGARATGRVSGDWLHLSNLGCLAFFSRPKWSCEFHMAGRVTEAETAARNTEIRTRPSTRTHTHTHSSLYSNCSLPQLNATVALSGLRCECDVCLRIIYYCIWSCHLSEERWLWSLCKIWPFF